MYEMILGSAVVFLIGGILVYYRVYRRRTREPDVSGIVESMVPGLPDNVSLEDALGRLR